MFIATEPAYSVYVMMSLVVFYVNIQVEKKRSRLIQRVEKWLQRHTEKKTTKTKTRTHKLTSRLSHSQRNNTATMRNENIYIQIAYATLLCEYLYNALWNLCGLFVLVNCTVMILKMHIKSCDSKYKVYVVSVTTHLHRLKADI